VRQTSPCLHLILAPTNAVARGQTGGHKLGLHPRRQPGAALLRTASHGKDHRFPGFHREAASRSLGAATEYLVETYTPRTDEAAIRHAAGRARIAAEQLTRDGNPVRLLHSIFVPEDETCLYLYEAASADAVHEAARRAGLPFERVAEAIAEPNAERA
jgi:Protein of unknown function (DUF4242)